MMKKLAIIAAALLTATNANALFDIKAKTIKDDFDGSTSVHIAETSLYCGMSFECPLVGFSWGNNTQQYLGVHIQFIDMFSKNFYNINRLSINIDGNIENFDAIKTTSHQTDSTSYQSLQTFLVPADYIEKLNNGKDIKIRVSTNKGNYDGVFKGGKKPSKAEKFYPSFYTEVKKHANQ
ncbi:hypothetical protein [Moraxella sp.]|uniref:hypothetical protein n=1 Tax=Moraxella sp. TaxID=479 RepID=UPI0026DCE948|nr:hypothetical protein [Moraxella sp.]MDO4895001.1 hypothetical protein [Moraxella sp.]